MINDMKKYNWKKSFLAIVFILLIIVGLFMFVQSGILDKEPVVEIKPDNCYEDTLVVLTDEDYRPYSFYDACGEYSGHDVELISLIANELHCNLDLRFMNWYDAIDAFTAGEADVLMTCDYSDSFAGLADVTKSEPISADDFIVYSKKKVSSLDELYGKRIGIMLNGNVTSQVKMMGLSKFCLYYDDNRKAMQALIDDDVDFAIMRQTVGTVLLQELDAFGVDGYISIGQSYMCFGISGKDPLLADRINYAIENLKVDGRLSQLRNKWLTTFVRTYTIIEILENNRWIVVSFGLFLIIIALMILRNRTILENEREVEYKNAQIIEMLAQDFVCINFLKFTDDPLKDTVVNYRVSEELKTMIPGWEDEKNFFRKLELLRDNFVYEPDREQFMIDINRSKAFAAFAESDVFFVNMRALVNNEIKYFQFKFSAVRGDGKLLGAVAGLHSVDEQTRKELALNERLQDALKEAEAANRAKSDFLFNMSHDIRTPMNAILGFTAMAEKYLDDKDRAIDALHKAAKSGNLLLSLINSVLDVSRIEAGKATLEECVGDVLLSFVSIEDTMQELAATKNVKLSFEFGEIYDRYVICDITRCNRIFLNIISNGIKYSGENGYVRVKCKQLGAAHNGYGIYQYIFEDNGIGMSEEFQKHIFEQFSREKSVTMSGIQGTGLGMAVCKSFIDLMGGTIECQSELNKGTTFVVTLTFKLQEGERYRDPITQSELNSSGEAVKVIKADFTGRRVLITEDNELNREIARDILEEYGMIVEEATDGSEAVAAIKEKGPRYYDFILMDIQMPIMNGYEATRAIRDAFPDVRIPIIALSANAFAEDKQASLDAGMDSHVAKPIKVEELLEALSLLM